MASTHPKLIELPNPSGGTIVYFYCPGCKHGHGFEVPRWSFNRDFEKPTFSPSLLVFYTKPKTNERVTCCHLFLRNGILEFLGDCPHALKGTKVPLVDWPEDYHKPGDPSPA